MSKNTCKKTDCGSEFEDSEKFKNKSYCPVCVCAAQMEMIVQHNFERKAISEAMGEDFIKNLLLDLSEGKVPTTVSLGDGRKAVVMDPKLFKASQAVGSRQQRRRWDRMNDKIRRKREKKQ